jgi:ribosomal-protein-alanine N-acetyltransferase
LISSREATVIIAESSNKVSGFAIVTFAPVSAHINLLAVNPVSRRSGVATAMIDWLVESCQVAGLGCIRLEVRAANLGAIKCYNKLGFESVGVTRGYYDRKEDAQHMVLTLISPETEKRRPA